MREKRLTILVPKITDFKGLTKFKKVEPIIVAYETQEFSKRSSDEIFFHDFIESKIIETDGILIHNTCKWEYAAIVILHIRLTQNWEITNKPIIWMSTEDFHEIPFDKNYSFIPQKNTFHFNRLSKSNHIEFVEDSFIKLIENPENYSFIENIIIKPNIGSHHIANEWGAFKLAYTSGLQYLLPQIEEKQPRSKTLYFKYLKTKHGIKIDESSLIDANQQTECNKKFLLIDDNFDKGWELVFRNILSKIDSTLGLDSFEKVNELENNEENLIKEIVESIQTENYQGVLLDLRLTSSDENENKKNANAQDFTGGRILKKLKEEFPHVPVIMVTASNKAWNMQNLIDLGADGYYIKENPESNIGDEISFQNYESFQNLIKQCILKYEALSPFWNLIHEIENGETLIQEHLIDVAHNGATQGKNTKIQQRIVERLKMFFGLLKRSYEDSEYNSKFHYSDIKLAFMTLWSCLNDIQFSFYKKTEWLTSSGKSRINIEIKQELITKLDLLTISDFDFFLQKKESTSNNFETRFKSDYSLSPVYQLMPQEERIRGNNWAGAIGEQIAFLILSFGRSSKLGDKTSGTITCRILANNLVDLKNKRNHIYITHGNESEGSDFFCKLEQDSGEITLVDCAELFEIVFFLITGTYVKIEIF